jgi:hypothetical protein
VIDSMLIPELNTMRHYNDLICRAGCRIVAQEDLTHRVSKTWDLVAELTRNPRLWRIARSIGPDLVRFFHGFRAMQTAFRNNAFQHGLIVAEKTSR